MKTIGVGNLGGCNLFVEREGKTMVRASIPKKPRLLPLIALLFSFSSPTFAQQSNDDLQAAVQNPVADLISVPFQNNTLFGIGPDDEVVDVLNIQPVVPFSLSSDVNVITRTIAPLIYIPDSVEGLDVLPETVADDTEFGLGDINVTAFFSPAKPSGAIWGVGPSLTVPTATDDVLGSKKWSAGPSAVMLVQPKPWTIGVLARHLWSFAGDSDRNDVNQSLLQPFVNYNLDDGWYLVSAPVITANWEASSGDEWTVPIGGGAGRLFKAGKLPINTQLSSFYNVEHPDAGPDWSIRLQVQFLFPK